jgi:hypothetical protein
MDTDRRQRFGALANSLAALKASIDHCRGAYGLSDAEAAGRMVKVFGEDHTAMYALIGNAMHDDEHYGNIVTYMRMLGLIPPSTAGGQ